MTPEPPREAVEAAIRATPELDYDWFEQLEPDARGWIRSEIRAQLEAAYPAILADLRERLRTALEEDEQSDEVKLIVLSWFTEVADLDTDVNRLRAAFDKATEGDK